MYGLKTILSGSGKRGSSKEKEFGKQIIMDSIVPDDDAG